MPAYQPLFRGLKEGYHFGIWILFLLVWDYKLSISSFYYVAFVDRECHKWTIIFHLCCKVVCRDCSNSHVQKSLQIVTLRLNEDDFVVKHFTLNLSKNIFITVVFRYFSYILKNFIFFLFILLGYLEIFFLLLFFKLKDISIVDIP